MANTTITKFNDFSNISPSESLAIKTQDNISQDFKFDRIIMGTHQPPPTITNLLSQITPLATHTLSFEGESEALPEIADTIQATTSSSGITNTTQPNSHPEVIVTTQKQTSHAITSTTQETTSTEITDNKIYVKANSSKMIFILHRNDNNIQIEIDTSKLQEYGITQWKSTKGSLSQWLGARQIPLLAMLEDILNNHNLDPNNQTNQVPNIDSRFTHIPCYNSCQQSITITPDNYQKNMGNAITKIEQAIDKCNGSLPNLLIIEANLGVIGSPQFYQEIQDLIDKAKQKNMAIIVVTKTVELMKKFLLKNEHYPNIYVYSSQEMYVEQTNGNNPALSNELKERICQDFNKALTNARLHIDVSRQYQENQKQVEMSLTSREPSSNSGHSSPLRAASDLTSNNGSNSPTNSPQNINNQQNSNGKRYLSAAKSWLQSCCCCWSASSVIAPAPNSSSNTGGSPANNEQGTTITVQPNNTGEEHQGGNSHNNLHTPRR